MLYFNINILNTVMHKSKPLEILFCLQVFRGSGNSIISAC